MSHLSVEAKEAIVQQVLNRGTKSIRSIAESNNIGLSSLQKWVRAYREGHPINGKPASKALTHGLGRAEQFQHILATHTLDDVSLGKYCREHGLYAHQLTKWREVFMAHPKNDTNSQHQSTLNKLKHENKQLQQELSRKDKALAEASALLILKKKAELIWGVNEDV